jgi:hypothetical protein
MGKGGRIQGGKERGAKGGRTERTYKMSKKAILLDIQVKFGSLKAKQIKNILDKINDINRLEKIKKEAIRAENWEDFSKIFRNHKGNKSKIYNNSDRIEK